MLQVGIKTNLSGLARRRSVGGFTLVEVLVTMIVLAVGLLGLSGIQLTGLKNNDSAYLRSQTIIQANALMERMRANRDAAMAGDYNVTLKALSEISVPSGGAGIAEFDRYQWFQQLDANLPDAKGAINCDANAVCTVLVQWDDTRAEGRATIRQNVLNALL